MELQSCIVESCLLTRFSDCNLFRVHSDNDCTGMWLHFIALTEFVKEKLSNFLYVNGVGF